MAGCADADNRGGTQSARGRDARAVGESRAVVFPLVAGRESALQADRARRRVGDTATATDDGRVHSAVRTAGEGSVGRRALSDLRVCWASALDLLRERS